MTTSVRNSQESRLLFRCWQFFFWLESQVNVLDFSIYCKCSLYIFCLFEYVHNVFQRHARWVFYCFLIIFICFIPFILKVTSCYQSAISSDAKVNAAGVANQRLACPIANECVHSRLRQRPLLLSPALYVCACRRCQEKCGAGCSYLLTLLTTTLRRVVVDDSFRKAGSQVCLWSVACEVWILLALQTTFFTRLKLSPANLGRVKFFETASKASALFWRFASTCACLLSSTRLWNPLCWAVISVTCFRSQVSGSQQQEWFGACV